MFDQQENTVGEPRTQLRGHVVVERARFSESSASLSSSLASLSFLNVMVMVIVINIVVVNSISSDIIFIATHHIQCYHHRGSRNKYQLTKYQIGKSLSKNSNNYILGSYILFLKIVIAWESAFIWLYWFHFFANMLIWCLLMCFLKLLRWCIHCICFTFLNCELSNVFLKHLHKRMHSPIGCICVPFLHCAF